MDLTTAIARTIGEGTLTDGGSDSVALEMARSASAMWKRTVFDPGHFTASGFVASPDGAALLLIEHRRLGRWLQPGGHFEPQDASVDEAARREVHEETGIDDLVRLDERVVRIDAHPIPARSDEPAHIHVDLAMAYRASRWDIGPIDEVLDARWVPFSDLDAFDTDDAVRRGASGLRALLGQ